MQYQFGDQDLAAQRLEFVAGVFEKPTREWLQQAAARPLRQVFDLGCGPGFTTRLLAETLECEAITGLDTSERFLKLARLPESSRLRFQRHDVQATPFPGSHADLIFCRFLLSHLPKPLRCIDRWGTQLEPFGLLVLEEVEAIETSEQAFANYLHIVESMLASQQTALFVGPVLESLPEPSRLRKRLSRAQRFAVSNRDAATMFSMNVPNWKDRPFVRESFGDASIQRLEDQLRDFAQTNGDRSDITWVLRQMSFERQPG